LQKNGSLSLICTKETSKIWKFQKEVVPVAALEKKE